MTRARDLAAGTFELATGGVLKLETSDTTVTDGSVLGKIEFKAPDEASGTDANLTAAAIEAVAEGTFAADNNATELVFKTGASAAADVKMILDSSGNLLVGKSAVAVSSVGAELRDGASDYAVTGVSSAQAAALFGRNSNDGDIIRLRKDNAAVGSIGTLSSVGPYIGNGDTALMFRASANSILPWDTTTNYYRDNAIDLGDTGDRFKDLYLSGGVFLGGTGAANKLSDYEEGTWTPAVDSVSGFTGSSITNINARYTKIGRQVTLEFEFDLNSSSGNIAAGDDVVLTAACLPFTPSDSGHATGTAGVQVGISTGENVAMGYIGFAASHKMGILFHTVDGTAGRTNTIGGVCTYFTS